MSISLAPSRHRPSRNEEIANSVSHGIGLIAALVATPFIILHAIQHGRTGYIVGASLFTATMVLLYLSSTLYHALPIGLSKRVFRIVDHCAIFLLIAGTYTPFTLGVLHGAWGWTLFGLVWGLAVAGIALKVSGRMSHPVVYTGQYLIMGWLILIAIKPLYARVPPSGIRLLVAGGIAYTAGVAFLATDSRLRYGHFIWHLFVMTGTVCHCFAVFWYAT